LLNANTYPDPTRSKTKTERLAFVYVGRLHESKGVHVLLMALEQLSSKHSFSITIVGSGPSEPQLRSRFGEAAWCRFVGQVDQRDVSNYIIDADALCIPSVWFENSPGVVEHALRLGVPVIGSDKGGIPELVSNGENGLLVAPGDVSAWQVALDRVLSNPKLLRSWATYTASHTDDFNVDHSVSQYEAFISEISNIGFSPSRQ
jgi:glycosyltransferase involved in cell wall biosynthesis